MNKVQYSERCWTGSAVHSTLWNLLLQKDVLIEISAGEPPFQVVLGIPHHAAPQINRIAENWINPRTGHRGRPADETTGLCGLAVQDRLTRIGVPSRLVIAVHPTDHDPNKTPGCPYWESVFSDPLPDIICELHGAGKKRRHDLELSAGRNRQINPLNFGRLLAAHLSNDWSLAAQTHPSTREAHLLQPNHNSNQPDTGRLENPALSTLSLSHASSLRVPALHLEMKPFLRQPDPGFPHAPQPTPDSWQLATALAETLHAALQNASEYILKTAPFTRS